MTVAVIGTRGFPNVQGGVERHCEELYTRLAARGVRVVVFSRSPYMKRVPRVRTWRGVRLQKVWTPRHRGLEALWHSVASLLVARVQGVRLVHVHALGPGLVVPLARLLRMRVVFTHHGRDYMRQKWGFLARWTLRAGEAAAVHYADEVLGVSMEIVEWLASRFNREAGYAPNGIAVDDRTTAQVESTLASFDLAPRGYAVTVARLVPEKGVHDLLDAIGDGSEVPCLVVVGGADHRSAYAADLQTRSKGVTRFAGVQPHEVTLDLVRGARLFVLPSYHEGLPIALLEAMACGTPVVASDIAPHREIITSGENGWLVGAGDVSILHAVIVRVWKASAEERAGVAARGKRIVAESFSWDRTVEKVLAAYADR